MNKLKYTKGVSPLLAWVLIIGLSVSMGFLVINWAMEVIPEPEPNFSFCDDVNLFLIDYSIGEDNLLTFNLKNTGLFTITKWSFSLIEAGNVPGARWCEETRSGWNLAPGEEKSVTIYMGNYIGSLCDSFEPFMDADGVIEITPPLEVVLTPWISPISPEEKINCNDKKIKIVEE